VTLIRRPFADMVAGLADHGVASVDAIAFDIGVSSMQIDEAERGFSFMKDGPLDMRMGAAGPSAADVVNTMSERGLADVIFRLGEERNARRIARSIVERRVSQPFETTADLAALVEVAVGGRRGARTHPATHTFQAIRMYVNDELGELARGVNGLSLAYLPGSDGVDLRLTSWDRDARATTVALSVSKCSCCKSASLARDGTDDKAKSTSPCLTQGIRASFSPYNTVTLMSGLSLASA
jgi:hypothetical protein